jgi:hypothetical protein
MKSFYISKLLFIILILLYLLQNTLYAQENPDMDQDKPSSPRFYRTLIEITILNSFGVLNYWLNQDSKEDNMKDWEYKPNLHDFKRKFTDGWYLDSNAFRTNIIYHIYSGGIFHQTARSNGYGFFPSVAWTFIGSLIWEYVGEFREKVSLNDMIYTGLAGSLFGEALRHYSIYVEKTNLPAGIKYPLMTLFDPMRIFNRAIDRCFYDDIDADITFVNPFQILLSNSNRNYAGIGVTVRW